jgi:hypothetical protein
VGGLGKALWFWVYGARTSGEAPILESHGGYLCRVEALDAPHVVTLARRALCLDGIDDPAEVSLLISALPHRKIVRLAYDAPFTYGRRGAHWYERNHSLARLLSRELGAVVHAYVFDPEEMEQVVSYGQGIRVGGERLYLEDVELTEEEAEDDLAFERLKERWPLGHLAHVYGVGREELLRMPRCAEGALLDLTCPSEEDVARLALLLPRPRHAVGM